MKLRNVFGNRYRGTLGKAFVAASWKGHPYLRAYVTPRDPKTELQLRQRAIFREAVAAWHALSAEERAAFDRMASGMTGFNRFVSDYVRRQRNGAR